MIDVTDENYQGPREFDMGVQEMDDNVLNGLPQPKGEGWKLVNKKDCGSLMAYIFVRPKVSQ